MTSVSPVGSASSAGPLHSLLRCLVPFVLHGAGPVAQFYRSIFISREPLINMFLSTLENLHTALGPRVALASALQTMLKGTTPQRDLRPMFEAASMQLRRELNAEKGLCHIDPLYRTLTFELMMASEWYKSMLGIGTTPYVNADVGVHSCMNMDIRQDALLNKLYVAYRNAEQRAQLPSEYRLAIQEQLRLERDVFGLYRFDKRADRRILVHSICLDETVETEESSNLLSDCEIVNFGNFDHRIELKHQGRWREHTLACLPEDHRLIPELPDRDEITVSGEGWRHTVEVIYNSPLCHRWTWQPAPPKGYKALDIHKEVFELALPDKRGFLEKFFER